MGQRIPEKEIANFQFIGLFHHIIRLQYMQEQSQQTLLPGLKLFYGHPAFRREDILFLLYPRIMLLFTGATMLPFFFVISFRSCLANGSNCLLCFDCIAIPTSRLRRATSLYTREALVRRKIFTPHNTSSRDV